MQSTIFGQLTNKPPMVPSNTVTVQQNDASGNPDKPLTEEEIRKIKENMLGGMIARPTGENNSAVAEQNE